MNVNHERYSGLALHSFLVINFNNFLFIQKVTTVLFFCLMFFFLFDYFVFLFFCIFDFISLILFLFFCFIFVLLLLFIFVSIFFLILVFFSNW